MEDRLGLRWEVSFPDGNDFLPQLREVYSAYVANIDRIKTSITAAAFSVGLTMEWMDWAMKMERKALEKPNDQTWIKPLSDAWRQLRRGKISQEDRKVAMEKGLWMLGTMYHHYPQEVKTGIDSILSSAVVGGWVAFETLTGDLWEAAINARPSKLAMLRGKRNRISQLMGGKISKRANSEIDAVKSDDQKDDLEEKKISLAVFARETDNMFDARVKMGVILRSRFNFTILSGIRQAYSCAFDDRTSKEIDDALANKSIDTLSAVRNLIVHKAGVADKEYCDKLVYLPDLPNLEFKKPLAITGKLVQSLVSPTVICGCNLIEAVNQWLVRNP